MNDPVLLKLGPDQYWLSIVDLSLTGAAGEFEMDMKDDFIAIIAEADQKTDKQEREDFLRSEFCTLQRFPPQHLAILHTEVATY